MPRHAIALGKDRHSGTKTSYALTESGREKGFSYGIRFFPFEKKQTQDQAICETGGARPDA